MARDLLSLTGEVGPRAQKLAFALSGIGPLRTAAAALERAIKLELSQPGSGKVYYRGRSGAARRAHATRGEWVSGKYFHQASAPGEPPAVDSGRLRAATGTQEMPGVGSIRVGVQHVAAAALNFGHAWGNRVLAPRPFMEPALTKARPAMTAGIRADLQVAGKAALA